jgi:hypothetical protein
MSYSIDDIGNKFYFIIGGNEDIITMKKECKLRQITKEDHELLILTSKRFNTLRGNDVYIYLSSDGIPYDLELKSRKMLIKKGYFGRLEPGAKNFMWSIYKMFLREKVTENHKYLLNNTTNIIKDYSNGTSLEKIVKKYDQPPGNVYRVILKGYYGIKSPDEIKSILKYERIPKKYKSVIFPEVTWVNENDVITGADQQKVQEKALAYEEQIATFLKENGIEYETQENLVEQQEKEYGRAVATPDFLFKSKVYLNNCPISWIDAKHSYGGNMHFVKKSLTKQVARYNKLWGYGALLFSGSFSNELKIPGALLITYSAESSSTYV